MKFGFVAKHRGIWPVSWICEALGVSRSGFHAWLNRSPSKRAQDDEVRLAGIRSSFAGSDRTYGARRVWHDVLAEGLDAGLHRIERLMHQEGLRAHPRRRGLPKDPGQRHVCQSARDKDPLLEWAPLGGRIELLQLTVGRAFRR
jgi:putative transposase